MLLIQICKMHISKLFRLPYSKSELNPGSNLRIGNLAPNGETMSCCSSARLVGRVGQTQELSVTQRETAMQRPKQPSSLSPGSPHCEGERNRRGEG